MRSRSWIYAYIAFIVLMLALVCWGLKGAKAQTAQLPTMTVQGTVTIPQCTITFNSPKGGGGSFSGGCPQQTLPVYITIQGRSLPVNLVGATGTATCVNPVTVTNADGSTVFKGQCSIVPTVSAVAAKKPTTTLHRRTTAKQHPK